jgi:hypothetical protein
MRTTVALVVLLASLSAPAARGGQAPPIGCREPANRQFDFWVGDWDAVEAGQSTPSAHVRVTRMLDGCAIREEYEDRRGTIGESFSTFDRSRQRWHQSWVTNHGQLLLLDGEFRNRAMVLTGADPEAGAAGLARGTWTATPDGVREVGVTSSDGGRTWHPWFDLAFRPHARTQAGPRLPREDAAGSRPSAPEHHTGPR